MTLWFAGRPLDPLSHTSQGKNILNIMVFKILFLDCSLLVYRNIVGFYIDFVTNSFLNIEVPVLGVGFARSSLSSFV